MEAKPDSPFNLTSLIPLFLILMGLYGTLQYSYLLFHSLSEIFSIAVAFGIFMVVWNSQRFLDNNYLLFLGVAYFFIGSIDLVHTLAYKGMGVFEGYGANLATQLWIAARYMESISLLAAPLLFLFNKKIELHRVMTLYSGVTILLFLSIFTFNLFPDCFIDGHGLTAFKKISEYIISGILTGSVIVLFAKRNEFDPHIFKFLVLSVIITIVSELAFTFYVSVYGLSNLVGHFLKIISFFLVYKAIIATGLEKPYDLLFRNLKKSEERYRNFVVNAHEGIYRIDFTAVIRIDIPDEALVAAISRHAVIREVNDSLARMYGLRREDIIGRPITDFAPDYGKRVLLAVRSGQYQVNDVETRDVNKDGQSFQVSENFSAVVKDKILVRIWGMKRDITRQKKLQEDRETLIKELQDALAEVKILSGLLPICASCKKIRDDKGYWKQIEVYIQTHSNVSFTHGMCPDCQEKYYGQQSWYIKAKNKRQEDRR